MDIYRFADLAIMTTVAAALILSVKMALKAKLSARMHMLIWLVLLVQILCFPVKGLLPESNLALQTYLPSYDVQAMRDSANDTFPSEGRATVLNTDDRLQAGPSTQFAQAAHDAQESAFVAPIVPETVLLSVSLGLFIFFALRHIVFLRKYRALPLCVDTDILELFAECKNEVEIERDIRLKIGSASPMLAGLLRPVIYISDDYDREELRYVLIHELCHYKNKDIWLNVLSAAILCLFWFNPLMWFCFCVFRRDMEIYCDDRVVRITGSRREYATALLKTATGAPFLLATSSLIAGKNETAQRIKRMAALKEPKIWVSTLVALVAVMAAVALMLNGAPMTKTLTYPNSPDIVFDVPAKWIEGMETQDNGDLIFAGGTAGTSYIPVSDEVYS